MVIPESVRVISQNAFRGSQLETITISKYLQHINAHAFADCSNLASVTIGEGSHLLSIGTYAFSNTRGISVFNIPASVVAIGTWAFNGWTASQTINVYEAEDQYAATAKFGANWRAGCNAVIKYFE